MQIKCDYCNSMIDESLESCPHCGAPLSGANRTSSEQPKTIEELKAWYEAHHLPPEEITRFFIGKDIKEPKAFGIYKTNTDDFVVYKNKSTGERAVRYQGSDEKYAVNELYQRLKAEISDQKQGKQPRNNDTTNNKTKKGCLVVTLSLIIFIVLGALTYKFDDSPPNGYYKYQGSEYYHQGSNWYRYDATTDNWYESDNGSTLSDVIKNDNSDDYRFENHQGTDFEETSWYDAGYTNNDSDWDNDSDWGDYSSSDWDSGSTDFDSDW